MDFLYLSVIFSLPSSYAIFQAQMFFLFVFFLFAEPQGRLYKKSALSYSGGTVKALYEGITEDWLFYLAIFLVLFHSQTEITIQNSEKTYP